MNFEEAYSKIFSRLPEQIDEEVLIEKTEFIQSEKIIEDDEIIIKKSNQHYHGYGETITERPDKLFFEYTNKFVNSTT